MVTARRDALLAFVVAGGGSSVGPSGATFENGAQPGNGSVVIPWVG